MGKCALETGENVQMRPTRVRYQTHNLRTERRIDTGSTLAFGQLNGLANRMPDRGWSGARALGGHLRFKNCRFGTFMRKTLMQIRTSQMGD